MKFRLLDTGCNTPSMNMAIDEALLTSKLPVLRFYGWKPTGLSIGYFQSIKDFNLKNLKKHKIDLVRRITGGNAVLHDKELTYSFIIDEKEMPNSIIESYKIISKGLLHGLRNLGLKAVMNENVEEGNKSAVCFNDPSWYETLVNKKKIIGSAQKRINGKLLQHGAILIDIDVEKYCSLFKDCDVDLLNKVKKRMTSINNEMENFALARTRRGTVAKSKNLILRRSWDCKSHKLEVGVYRAKPLAQKPMNAKFSSNKSNYEIVKEAMKNGFEEALKIKFIEDKLSEEEKGLAERLDKEKYNTKKWNFHH